jgi:hypothetical protein
MDNVFLDRLLDGLMDVEIRQKELAFFHLPWNCKILIRIRRVRVQEDIKNRFLNICKL